MSRDASGSVPDPPSAVAERIKAGTWPSEISLTYICPCCGSEIDLREAEAI